MQILCILKQACSVLHPVCATKLASVQLGGFICELQCCRSAGTPGSSEHMSQSCCKGEEKIMTWSWSCDRCPKGIIFLNGWPISVMLLLLCKTCCIADRSSVKLSTSLPVQRGLHGCDICNSLSAECLVGIVTDDVNRVTVSLGCFLAPPSLLLPSLSSVMAFFFKL